MQLFGSSDGRQLNRGTLPLFIIGRTIAVCCVASGLADLVSVISFASA